VESFLAIFSFFLKKVFFADHFLKILLIDLLQVQVTLVYLALQELDCGKVVVSWYFELAQYDSSRSLLVVTTQHNNNN
jgi:hypothetical protein